MANTKVKVEMEKGCEMPPAGAGRRAFRSSRLREGAERPF